MLGQQNPQQMWLPKNLFDIFAEAKDSRGNTAKATVALSSEPLGENILLRLDKAVYKSGDTVNVDVRTSGGMSTVYLDVVRAGQTMLTKWLDVKDGKAACKLDLPASLFGTLEIHAYQVLMTGEIVRDARVVYVQAADDLKIDVKADKDVYQPGKEGVITFQVTDKAGKPTPAALGVLIVDEAVYALQDMQPGLEKVFFTLQEELLKPQVQAIYKAETIDTVVREPILAANKQRVAEVLLTAARPKAPARWDINPAITRRLQAEGQMQQIGWFLFNYSQNMNKPAFDVDAKTGKVSFKPGFLAEVAKQYGPNGQVWSDPIGSKLTLEGFSKMEPNFNAERMAHALTRQRIQNVGSWFIWYTQNNQAKFLKDGKWTFPETVLADAVKAAHGAEQPQWLKDAWGRQLKLVKRDKKIEHKTGQTQWDFYEIVSAGPDGKFDTADDVNIAKPHVWLDYSQGWWLDDGQRHRNQQMVWNHRRFRGLQDGVMFERGAFGGAGRGGAFPPGMPVPMAAAKEAAPLDKTCQIRSRGPLRSKKRTRLEAASPARVRPVLRCAFANTFPRPCCGGRRFSPTTAAGPRCR